MTRQRFLAKQQCVENIIVVDALDVTRNRSVSLDCACSAEIVYYRHFTAVIRMECYNSMTTVTDFDLYCTTLIFYSLNLSETNYLIHATNRDHAYFYCLQWNQWLTGKVCRVLPSWRLASRSRWVSSSVVNQLPYPPGLSKIRYTLFTLSVSQKYYVHLHFHTYDTLLSFVTNNLGVNYVVNVGLVL